MLLDVYDQISMKMLVDLPTTYQTYTSYQFPQLQLPVAVCVRQLIIFESTNWYKVHQFIFQPQLIPVRQLAPCLLLLMKFASVSSKVIFLLWCLGSQANLSLGQEAFDIQSCLEECENRCDSICQNACKADCFQANKPQAQKEEVEEASMDLYSRDFRPEREVNFRSRRRSRGETTTDEDDCGLMCDTKRINQCQFETCLRNAFSEEQKQVFFPCSEGWDRARATAFAGYKQPRAVVYAEDTSHVQTAVKCASDNGIKITARGRGHSFQGWGVVDGYLVVDMSKMCRYEMNCCIQFTCSSSA